MEEINIKNSKTYLAWWKMDEGLMNEGDRADIYKIIQIHQIDRLCKVKILKQ